MADRHCTLCGAVLATDDRFCGGCGAAAEGSPRRRRWRWWRWGILLVGGLLLGAAGVVFWPQTDAGQTPWHPADPQIATAALAYLEEHGPSLNAFDEVTDPVLQATGEPAPVSLCEDVIAALEGQMAPEELFSLTAQIPDQVLASLWLDAQWARAAALAYCQAGKTVAMQAEVGDALRKINLVEQRRAELVEVGG